MLKLMGKKIFTVFRLKILFILICTLSIASKIENASGHINPEILK